MGLDKIAARLRHPQTTVRWRLTLLYGGLFLVCGAALLAVTYALVARTMPAPLRGTDKICQSVRRTALGPGVGPQDVAPDNATAARLIRAAGVHARGGATLCLPVKTMPADGHVQTPAQVQRFLHSRAGGDFVRIIGHTQQAADLHRLEIESGIALAIMALISAFLGWVVAGRVLRPLRTITATTRRISEANLHERLELPGPRDELRTLADTIDALLARLEGAFDAQRRFVANASHELRTPLTVTRALLEMAIEDPDATVATLRETCGEALVESEQQERLIDALLVLARGQLGIERPQTFDLASVTGDVLQACENLAAGDDVRLSATLDPVQINGEEGLIERLILNLLQNAIRHNHPDGHVRVEVTSVADRAVLAVVNSGPLVPAAEIDRLLQPFQRQVGDRTGHPDGLGLGLSIVAAIVAAHDAELTIRPREHGGLEVEVSFPRAVDPHQPAPDDPDSRGARVLAATV